VGSTPMIGIAYQSTEAIYIKAIRCIDQLKVSDQFMALMLLYVISSEFLTRKSSDQMRNHVHRRRYSTSIVL